jgi:hypothetical protein
VRLIKRTFDRAWVETPPERLFGDRAYDSDPLDERLRSERGVEFIEYHDTNFLGMIMLGCMIILLRRS